MGISPAIPFKFSDRFASLLKVRPMVYIAAILMVLTACKDDKGQPHGHAHDGFYTCPMHPQVVRDGPGACPVCGMDLVKSHAIEASRAELMLTDSQIRLANITTERVKRRPAQQAVPVNGRITVDQEKSKVISSRAAGRIEKLYVKETGKTISAGEPVYVLYSELLLTLQQEYLLAREQYEAFGETNERDRSFLEAAARKLLLYGLTKDQIGRLTHRNALQPRITFFAPAGGTIREINASEGQYVAEGAAIYRVEDISSLWVEAELDPDETSLVKAGDTVSVMATGTEAGPIDARVIFLSPEYKKDSQVTIMRASINNRDNLLAPGQFARVYLTRSPRAALAVPSDAVIRDGHGSRVYVQSGHNTFRPQMVTTGLESFDMVEITGGINEGDTVAVTGAYLLYAEIILKKGTDPMAAH